MIGWQDIGERLALGGGLAALYLGMEFRRQLFAGFKTQRRLQPSAGVSAGFTGETFRFDCRFAAGRNGEFDHFGHE